MKRLILRPCKPIAFLFLTLSLIPGSSFASSAGTIELIQNKISQFLKRPGARSADWGIEVVDPTDNRILISINPDKPFQPASVLKVVTTAAALEKLGPDFKFRTGVYADGELLEDGTLNGDLILVGHGDPNLLDPEGELLERSAFEELCARLADLGITKVRGDVVGDDSYFEFTTHGEGWTARDLKSAYGAPINALSVNNNVFWVHARGSRPNQRVSLRLEPPTSYFHIRNLGVTEKSGSKRTLYVRVVPGTANLVISGVLPASQSSSHYILLERPAEAAATLFKEELIRQRIAVEGRVRTIHYGDLSPEARRQWKLLTEHKSPALIRALEVMNKKSLNLHAEMLLRVLGAEFGGGGTDAAGLSVVRDFLTDAGIRIDGVNLKDGSGLSRENLVTPHFQTSLLMYLATRPYFNLFLNTLAVSGTDGTLKNRLASKPVKGTIHAKTGSLQGVSTLSGYMTTKSGRNLAFSIFVNNVRASMWRVRKTIDEICVLLVNLY